MLHHGLRASDTREADECNVETEALLWHRAHNPCTSVLEPGFERSSDASVGLAGAINVPGGRHGAAPLGTTSRRRDRGVSVFLLRKRLVDDVLQVVPQDTLVK